MIAIIETLIDYLQYPFVVYALIVGTMISLCASLLGVSLVLKRFSYIGDGLSHLAFGTMVIASILNITNDLPFVLVITIICAVLLLKTNHNTQIKGDAAIAIISVSTLAIGYLLLNVFPTSSNITADVCTTLFGSTSILTLSEMDVWLSIGLSLLVVVVFIYFYNKIFAVTFDEDFSVAVGVRASMYTFLIAMITAVIIVLAIQLVGSLLITALVIFPALSAMRVFKNFRAVVICAAIFSIICAVLGILTSILWGTPVGATIVVVDITGFVLFNIVGKVTR